MSGKKLLIASSHKGEAITKWILNRELISTSIDIVFIEDLLKHIEIQDEVDTEGSRIKWCINNEVKYTNETHYLLNRIIYIEDGLFRSFCLEDKEYAKREFEAYLGFSLNAFYCPQTQASNGVCEQVKSLPQQWQMAKGVPGLCVPKYYWGREYCDIFPRQHNVVNSSIFNFINWAVTSDLNAENTGFCFTRPKGEVDPIGETTIPYYLDSVQFIGTPRHCA